MIFNLKFKIKNLKFKKGYIALITVLIVGMVASVIMISLLTLGLSYSNSSEISYQSFQARTLANGCAEEALRQIRLNTGYVATNITLNLGNNSCTYSVLNTGGNTRQIDAHGDVGTVTRKVQVLVGNIGSTITISSWQDIQ